MNKKGFTLIELLAVIVILAIIAIIATPIVLNIIKDANENAVKQSATTYIKAVEQGYVSKLTKNEKIENGEYNISTLDELGIKVKGDKPSGDDDYVTLQNGKVTDYSLTIKGYHIYYSEGDMIVDSGQDNDSKDKITALDYTVIFMSDGKPYNITSVTRGQEINAPATNPTSENGVFTGWKLNGEIVTFPHLVRNNEDIIATFSKVRDEISVSKSGDFICGAHGTKVNNGLAICGYGLQYENGWNLYAYTVGQTPEAVETDKTTRADRKGSFVHNGVTWYYAYSMSYQGGSLSMKTDDGIITPYQLFNNTGYNHQEEVLHLLKYYLREVDS